MMVRERAGEASVMWMDGWMDGWMDNGRMGGCMEEACTRGVAAVAVAICAIPVLSTHFSSRHSQSPLHQVAPLPCGQSPQPVIDS